MKVLLLVFTLVICAPAFAADYVIDTRGAHAAIQFKFKHIGISWLTGMFKTFDGSFSYDENNPGATKIVVNIDPASLDSNHAERDKHIRGERYLDAGKFPKAKFESTRVEPKGEGKARVFGNLTLHGVTREIAIEAALVGKGNDPWGGYRAGFEGTVVLNTEDFGVTMPPSNEVTMELYIEGVRK